MSNKMEATVCKKASLNFFIMILGLMISLILLAGTFALSAADMGTKAIVSMAILAGVASIATAIAARQFFIATK